MRQAGRYLPEYKAARARTGSFMGLATNVDYATEVTLQPLERFPLDAAILFSDILTVPRRHGPGPVVRRGEGPRFAQSGARRGRRGRTRQRPTWTSCAMCSTPSPASARPERPRAADRLLGQPWTLACYMVEGKGSDDYRLVKSLMYSRPT